MPTYLTSPPFIADRASITRDTGHTIDWDNVPADGSLGATGKRVIPAGTRMGRTANGIVPRKAESAAGAGDGIAAEFLLATPAIEDATNHARSTYGVIRGGVVYENLLPGGAVSADEKAELQAAGTGFAFIQYTDTTV